MAVFFTSDTHFGHGGALGLYRRPFSSVAAMNEGLVEHWNEVVGPKDVVWHLPQSAQRANGACLVLSWPLHALPLEDNLRERPS